MADRTDKQIAVTVLERIGDKNEEVGNLKTNCCCGSFFWTYEWKGGDTLKLVFYERSRKERKRGRDIFIWKLKVGSSGSLTEINRWLPPNNTP